jgi:hypothetical protein
VRDLVRRPGASWTENAVGHRTSPRAATR